MRIALRISLLALTLLAASSAPANALEIYGNTTSGLDNQGRQFGSSNLQFKQIAQGFTMGSTSYQLSSVQIGLNFGVTVPTSSQITVSLYDDNGSNRPGSSLGTFNTASPNPAFPTSNSAVIDFAYTGTTTLAASTKYWIVVENDPATSPVFDWFVADSVPINTQPVAKNSSGVTYLGTRGTVATAVTSWGTNVGNAANLRISVNVVPEPSTYALGMAGTLVMGAVARRRNRKTASA